MARSAILCPAGIGSRTASSTRDVHLAPRQRHSSDGHVVARVQVNDTIVLRQDVEISIKEASYLNSTVSVSCSPVCTWSFSPCG